MKYFRRFKSYVIEIPVNVAASTNAGSLALDINSEFVLCSISGSNLAANSVRLWDSNSNNLWSSWTVLGSSISRLYNAVLRDPNTYLEKRVLPANTTIYYELVDTSTYAVPYTCQIVLHGYEMMPVQDTFVFPEAARNMAVNFKVYSADATREANQAVREILRIDKSRFFVITAINAVSVGAFELRLSDSRFSSEWSNARMDSSAITGTAAHPFPLPVPVIFERNTSIFYDIRDTSGAANAVQLAFIGFEVL